MTGWSYFKIYGQKISIAFTPPNSIRIFVESTKDSINPKLHKLVYMIPFSSDKKCIGELRRSIVTRIKEHATDIHRNGTSKSTLVEHAYSS